MARAVRTGDVVVKKAVDEASRAAGRGDWDRAVAKLRTAMQALGDETPAELRQSLAAALVNRASRTAERAMRTFAASPAQPDLVAAFSAVFQGYKQEQREHKKRQRSPKRLAVRLSRWLVFAVIVAGLYLLTGVLIGNNPNANIGILRFAGAVIILFILGIIFEVRDRAKGHRPAHHDGPSCGVCGEEAAYEVSHIPLCASHADALKLAAQARPRLASGEDAEQVSRMLGDAEADLRAAALLAPGLSAVPEGLRQLAELRSRLGLPNAGSAA